MTIDALCIIFSFQWLIRNSKTHKSISLRFGAAATVFHAFRVLIYVLGRTGPWINFDIKPQYRHEHTVDFFWVYFAAILSVLGILGVMIIWIRIKRAKRNPC